MKSASNIISSVHHLKIAKEHMEDFQREHPLSKGAQLFEGYKKRVNWIVNDLITHPALPQAVRDGIRGEWESDIFAIPAIVEKIALLNPEQRANIECLIDACLKGEELKIVNENY